MFELSCLADPQTQEQCTLASGGYNSRLLLQGHHASDSLLSSLRFGAIDTLWHSQELPMVYAARIACASILSDTLGKAPSDQGYLYL